MIMGEPLSIQIIRKVKQVSGLYHRLVLVVAPSGSGKTSALREVQESLYAPLLNVNLELSRRMLDLTERQRALQLPRLLQEIVSKREGEMILLDNIEVLFDIGSRITWIKSPRARNPEKYGSYWNRNREWTRIDTN
jgi:ABC-type uncharacterized transport system ATPase component